MKVSVVGAGAIGSMLGGLIKHHHPEVDVMLIVRGEHGRAMNERRAVQLDGPWGTREVSINTSFSMADIAGSDYVLITVKSHACEGAIESADPHLGDAIVISIQNGINDEVLARVVADERLVMGMTATNMAILEPGAVSLQLDGTTVVGPASHRKNVDAAHDAAELLRKTGLQIDEHPNVLGVQYNKLAINALGYASCLSASNFITEAICNRGWRTHVGVGILDECIQAYNLAGIELAKIPGRPDVNKLRRFLGLLDVPIAGTVVALGAKQFYNKKPIVFSLYQDLLRGKMTEVDFINGEIVRLAAANGSEAPCNALAVEMVHELEKRGDASFFQREEVIERFRGLQLAVAETV